MSNGFSNGESGRQAVRVTDRIMMSANEVSADRFAELQESFDRGISPYNQEGLTDLQMYVGIQTALAHIQQKDEDLGRFLQHLDTKVNMILGKLSGVASPFDSLVMREVTISSTGMSFPAQKKFSKGALVEFNLVLLPDYLHIYCLGEVVDCREANVAAGEKNPNVCCKFTLIMEEDRERLVQHNFRQQSLALRNRRLGRDDD